MHDAAAAVLKMPCMLNRKRLWHTLYENRMLSRAKTACCLSDVDEACDPRVIILVCCSELPIDALTTVTFARLLLLLFLCLPS